MKRGRRIRSVAEVALEQLDISVLALTADIAMDESDENENDECLISKKKEFLDHLKEALECAAMVVAHEADPEGEAEFCYECEDEYELDEGDVR